MTRLAERIAGGEKRTLLVTPEGRFCLADFIREAPLDSEGGFATDAAISIRSIREFLRALLLLDGECRSCFYWRPRFRPNRSQP